MKLKQIALTSATSLMLFSVGASTVAAHADTTIGSNPTQTISSQDDQSAKVTKMINKAQKFTGLRYVWGGTSTRGFDCSGFTQYNYRKSMKIKLPRTAQAQYNFGAKVNESQAQAGDLVFFGSGKSGIDHVGIYLGNGKMIDSQNRGVVTENVHAPWWNLVGYAHYGA